jgi:hypothetical protein
MALEDRIRTSVDQAVDALVQHLVETSQEEVTRQVRETEAQIRADLERKVAEARESDRRARAALEQQLAEVREAEQRAAEEIQAALRADFERQARDAELQAEARLTQALAEGEARAIAETRASIAEARARERESEMAGTVRLLESIRGLDGATSLSEVLDALGLAAGREAARAAVVVLKGDRLLGWRLTGFGPRDAQPKSIDLAPGEAGVIGLAASSARLVTTHGSHQTADGPGFEHLPPDRMGMAMPVLVGGRVVAVVYADGVTGGNGHERSVPSAWPELIEILARHAGRCLEALTAQKAAASGVRKAVVPGTAATSATGQSGPSSAAGATPPASTAAAQTGGDRSLLGTTG